MFAVSGKSLASTYIDTVFFLVPIIVSSIKQRASGYYPNDKAGILSD
jgi:hypothetical protein